LSFIDRSRRKLTDLVDLEPSDSCGVGLAASVDGVPSRRILELGLISLANFSHRGAVGADGKTGDGAGVTTTIPTRVFSRWMRELEIEDAPPLVGIGVLFLPSNTSGLEFAMRMVSETITSRGLRVLGIRDVPIEHEELGDQARNNCPVIKQIFIAGKGEDADHFERELFLARRAIELTPIDRHFQNIHIASMSARTISYKAMVLSGSLSKFYPDLEDPEFECSICVFHQRFSTNTSPQWSLCQPFRMLAHNGEINTIRGNRNWMTAREPMLSHPYWSRSDRRLLRRLFNFNDSDSASLDNVLELLTLSGRNILHAMSVVIPPAWQNDPRIDDAQKAFYEFHSCFSEPWDGPAAVAATDGKIAAACLDRNGLRPARYKISEDNIFLLGSEVGADRIDDETVIKKGRLGPGEMVAVDIVNHRILFNDEIKSELAARQDYEKWLAENRIVFSPTENNLQGDLADFTDEEILRRQIAAGLTREEIEIGIKKMAEDGVEPTFSMGVDTPLAVLSAQPRQLSDYFKQQFAQVTNPPIDPIRERSVMSLAAGLGPERNLLDESPLQCRVMNLDEPVLLPGEMESLMDQCPFKTMVIDCTWSQVAESGGLKNGLHSIVEQARMAVDDQVTVIVLSDRAVNKDRIAIPMLMAVGAVHQALCKSDQRLMCSLIAETSEVRDPHQLALLFSYGCTAVYPYLAFATIRSFDKADPSLREKCVRFRDGLNKGILKIMSKMGISVLNSYQGAQTFEAIGVGPELIETCFKYSYSNIGGIGIDDIETDCLIKHEAAFEPETADLTVFDAGMMKPRRSGEHHVINGKVTKSFHQFVRENKIDDFEAFQEEIRPQAPVALRDLLEFSSTTPIPIEEVESIEEIRRRFTTAAMSLGAISPEAHEAIAIAMNEIGGKSNSGEGGEDPRRFQAEPDGRWANSKIKQVASGRFGVNAEYLTNALEIEIKMAQGAKPGEGGQLPGFKVNGLIAKLRNTEPGVTLISPPPHHDIYSIEDLAQLIYDLKMVNPVAKVCVKLVAKTGVGGIAVGVAKSFADVVLISGHEGGTGASPLTSIKHAGIPWELGVAETHQSLIGSGLRDRVVLRADGGLRTGNDIIKAAILGAEEFNFGTMALIALGCVYVKKCHLNNCPVGIATQDPKYRAKFKGKPENLINYLNAVATECRRLLAQLGYPTMDQLIGQTQLLEFQKDKSNKKTFGLDLSPVFAVEQKPAFVAEKTTTQKYAVNQPLTSFDDSLLDQVLYPKSANLPRNFEFEVCNTDRNIGTRISGFIATRHGKTGLPSGSIQLSLTGTAGQSLGAFLCNGITIRLSGEANDYVGKGMSGGEIIIRPLDNAKFESSQNVIAGNTVLYGATGGKFFASGIVAERFCIRNSGAIAVVEGCGDHSCEYMTKGTAVILGSIGNNFAAGMTGGEAFVFDPDSMLDRLCNQQTVEIVSLNHDEIFRLKELIVEFQTNTDSRCAKAILEDWSECSKQFRKVSPLTGEPNSVRRVIPRSSDRQRLGI